MVDKIAPTTATVLIQGESGTGKELIARRLHSARRSREQALRHRQLRRAPGIAARERALRPREGLLHRRRRAENAASAKPRTTDPLFLDEIGEMSLGIQAKLLRFLQEGEFYRIGGKRPIKVDVRVVSRDQPRPRARGERESLPRGPLLPAEHDHSAHASAPQAQGGHPVARRVLPQKLALRRLRAADPQDRPARDGSVPELRLAGQHPRAAEHDRAAQDPGREQRNPPRGHPVLDPHAEDARPIPASSTSTSRSRKSRKTTSCAPWPTTTAIRPRPRKAWESRSRPCTTSSIAMESSRLEQPRALRPAKPSYRRNSWKFFAAGTPGPKTV